jgi:acetyl esterase/lipase
VSPVYGSLAGLPPLLIQAGSHEILLDDAIRLAALLDEGEAALTRAGGFLREHMAAGA